MKHSQLAAQLYTVRSFMQYPADIAGSLAKIKKIGYDAVQISGIGKIEDTELAKICKNEGLTICATHEGGAEILDNVDAIIEKLKNLNCKYTAYPWPHAVYATAYGVADFAHRLNESAKKMAAAGQVLCYHNHAIEFQKRDGELMLDIIYREAPNVKGELDTYWVQTGGKNPTDWIRKLSGRLPLLHLKEYAIVENSPIISYVGGGNLDWKEIIHAGEAAGVEYFIVEQDDCHGMCPFEALKRSYDYITENFVDRA